MINICTNQTADGRIVGDAAFRGCIEVAAWVTPVSGGAAPVTVAIPVRNAVTAA